MKTLSEYIFENTENNTEESTKVIYTFELDDNTQINVEDIENYKNSGHTARALSSDEVYYSVIWKNKKLHTQPEFTEIQRIIKANVTDKQFNRALILGGGGCTLSRFILLEYPQTKIDVVELYPELVDVAKKYFLNDLSEDVLKNQNLITGDAFEYLYSIPKNAPKYDCVVVDLFSNDQICEEIFSDNFIFKLKDITTDDCVIIYSALMTSEKEIMKKLTPFFSSEKLTFIHTDVQNVVEIHK